MRLSTCCMPPSPKNEKKADAGEILRQTPGFSQIDETGGPFDGTPQPYGDAWRGSLRGLVARPVTPARLSGAVAGARDFLERVEVGSRQLQKRASRAREFSCPDSVDFWKSSAPRHPVR